MVKGQMRGNKEKKKPKAEWNKKKKAGPAPSPFGAAITYKSAYTQQGKKGSQTGSGPKRLEWGRGGLSVAVRAASLLLAAQGD